ncbi:hypothetical protein PtB15_1B532 [Puccinia triticina]|nr:hypothetical protein PtB15_1B532 [Puccinia triticina]
MGFHFFRQLHFMLLLTKNAFLLTTLDSGGHRIPRLLFDLNEFPPDEPPTTPRFCPLQPTPLSDSLKGDFVAQSDQVGLHCLPMASTSDTFRVNHYPTSPRKRKTVGASIEHGQTEAPIDLRLDQRQKTRLKYQNNWPVENASKPEGITATTAKLQQKEKETIENYKITQNDPNQDIRLGRLEEDERKHVLFDVQDWSFVRKNSNMQSDDRSQSASKENHTENFFKAMREIKRNTELELFKEELDQTSNEYFWIPKEYERTFISRFRAERSKVPYPDEKILTTSQRKVRTFNTILELSDEKLNLEGRFPHQRETRESNSAKN